jgi:diaminohydroxyphosphoribosylaminopyrimidine deaminase/5-amino-6-(5-phosphoribosylamino)uracil reductase
MVGCVIVSDGEVVGEGWHAAFGGPHAEQVALAEAGDRARGGTAVVTLEPCAHTGKQPPCTEALIAAGVARVVMAMRDPNPEATGGSARLEAAGIVVDHGVGAPLASYQLAGFLHRHRGIERPWVVVKLALSLDGRIADAAGQSQWISGAAAREWVHWLRAGFDAIGVGGTTVAADNPSLTVRGDVEPREPPRRIVFAGRGGVSPKSRLLTTADETPTTIVTSARQPAAGSDWEDAGATVLHAADLAGAMEQLWQSGVGTCLIEGGGRLVGALLAAGLVDRLCLIHAPIVLGDGGVPAVAGWEGLSLATTPGWKVVERKLLGVDTLTVLEPG